MQLKFKSNLQEVILRQVHALAILTASTPENRGKIFREALLSVLALQKQRIFEEGKNEDGKSFGRYTAAYLKVRAKYHHSNTNINFDLTDETMREYTVGDTENGIGLGYLNKANENSKSPNAAQKSKYLEARYGKFFDMSYKEQATWLKVVNKKIVDILSGKTR
jgi:hypothetical protein